jgi:threonine aldolase
MDYLQQASGLARQHGLAVHLDGARVMNAAVDQAAAHGSDAVTELRAISDLFDSVSVCFSKGLGAPVGSALCGSKELIHKAHRARKMLGGGMRQSGVLAAAALHALDHHVNRLIDDHALAKRLADGLQGLPGLTVRSAQTNIVFVDVADGRGPALLAHLQDNHVLATGLLGLRFVTHLDVDAAGIDHAIACVRRFLESGNGAVSSAARSGGPY